MMGPCNKDLLIVGHTVGVGKELIRTSSSSIFGFVSEVCTG